MTLEVHDVSVRFGGVKAVNNVSLRLEPGEILAVIGPNGSGKSTLFNAITGMVKVASGHVKVNEERIDALPPYDRVGLGLARTFQTPRFDPQVTVSEAVMCGFFPICGAGILSNLFRAPSSAREEAKFRERCDEILEDLNLTDFRALQMGELPMGRVRLVEVARAIANRPKYILLDEPAAGLTRDEQRMLGHEIRRLAESKVGVLLVEHNFNLIRDLVERAIVLKDGNLFLEGAPNAIAKNPEFIDVYLGGAAP